MPSSESEESIGELLRKAHPQWFYRELTTHVLDDPCALGKQHYGYCVRKSEYMPVHGYKSEDGEYIEKQYSVYDTIPPFIEENGKVYKRVWSFQGFQIK